MGGKRNGRAVIILTSMIFFGMSLWCMGKPQDEFSPSERRHLAEIPKFTADEVLSGRFMRQFEEYAADQFPMREEFRRLNSVFQFYVLGKKEVNNIYVSKGYAEKLMLKADRKAAEKWLNRILYICDTYAGENRVYLSFIPDKNYFLSRETGYPYLDYQEFTGFFWMGQKAGQNISLWRERFPLRIITPQTFTGGRRLWRMWRIHWQALWGFPFPFPMI